MLMDVKLPRHLRPSLPLLLCDGKPLWLAPLRRTRLALMSPGQSGGMRLTLLGRDRLPPFPQPPKVYIPLKPLSPRGKICYFFPILTLPKDQTTLTA